MKAYRYSDLYNKYVIEEATDARRASGLSDHSYAKILKACPGKLYTPDFFIRIALGLLTLVAVLFSGLLLWLVSSASASRAITTLLISLALLCHIALEILVRKKQYYNAGVDNILMIMVITFIISVFFVPGYEASWLVISSVSMSIGLWLTIRFTDSFMAMVSYCCLFIFIFMAYIRLGNIARATAPIMMMVVSALVYFVMKKMIDSKTFMYRSCFKAVAFLTLVTFYASGNYFIVKEVSNQMFHQQLSLNDPIPFGWLFWILTLIIPPAYIIYGILEKDLLVMRTGLGLIAATILTVKYYYPILPLETEMLGAGIILIALSYALIKYLAAPKYGFTSIDQYPSKKGALHAEALIIAETFSRQANIENDGLYGGGSGGGGGATGEF